MDFSSEQDAEKYIQLYNKVPQHLTFHLKQPYKRDFRTILRMLFLSFKKNSSSRCSRLYILLRRGSLYLSALQILANSFRASLGASLYVDLPCFHSLSIITGDNFRPDLVSVSPDNKIFFLQLTVGFENNLEANTEHKRAKYKSIMDTLKYRYTDVKFVNLSISSLGIFGLSSSSFIEMCCALAADMEHRHYLISKLSNTIIRTI